MGVCAAVAVCADRGLIAPAEAVAKVSKGNIS